MNQPKRALFRIGVHNAERLKLLYGTTMNNIFSEEQKGNDGDRFTIGVTGTKSVHSYLGLIEKQREEDLALRILGF